MSQKRGEFKRNNIWSNKTKNNQRNYDEHDDRDRAPTDITIRKKNGNRRVSFKANAQKSGDFKKLRAAELGLRTHFEDEDERMIEFNGAKAGTFRRRNSPIPSGARQKNKVKLIENASEWFQVNIPYGTKYDKEFLLGIIAKSIEHDITPIPFQIHYWKIEANRVSFYVDEFKVAKALTKADREIEMPNGFKLLIKVRNAAPPVLFNAELKERMKLAMAKRYNSMTKALDLTKFHADSDLTDIYCGLARAPIIIAAIDIIGQNIPDLEALNLENNKIYTLETLKTLFSKAPNLKILHLANNKITTASNLEPLRKSDIVDLVLKGNPICDRLRDESVYIREVRKRIPRLQKLDGLDLPAQIKFDIESEENAKLPPAKASYLADQSGADIVRQFLHAYFQIFDSDNRQPLLDAYHENCMFSMTCTFNPNPEFKLAKFLPFNRNLNRIRDPAVRNTLLKCGKLPVVSFLSELPQTEHDPQSFACDLTLFTPQLLVVSLTGVFREKQTGLASERRVLRSFHRSMVIVRFGSGFCIKNDMLHVNNLTYAQVKTAFKPIEPAPVTPSQVQPPIQTPTPLPANVAIPDDVTKLQMIEALSQQTQMNIEWSRKCLEETNWDYQKASHAFSELHKQNRIPAEAFIK